MDYTLALQTAQPPWPQWQRPVKPGSGAAPKLSPKTVYLRETFFDLHFEQETFCFWFLTSASKRWSHFSQRYS